MLNAFSMTVEIILGMAVSNVSVTRVEVFVFDYWIIFMTLIVMQNNKLISFSYIVTIMSIFSSM